MKLSDTKVRNVKGKEKPYKLTDGGGLFLLVNPNGKKYWRMKYRYLNREKLLSFGVYPDISLADARERRDEARKLKAKGFDPSEHKRQQKEKALLSAENSFRNVAIEWHQRQGSKWSAYYGRQIMARLEKDIFPKIGGKPIHEITARDLLRMANVMQDRDAVEIAHRAVSICSQVFRYALLTDRAENNPALALRGALKTPKVSHYAHLTTNELPGFLKDLEAYNGGFQTKLAIELLVLTFVRTTELREATWSEINFEQAEWRIPAARMKMRTPHIVPLSKQALDILTKLKKLAGKWEHVFPSIQSPRKAMCNNTMLYALYSMGYKDRTTIHGFRATASTVLNESGLFGHDVIERQLAHQERNRVRAAYNHADYLPERRKMMQWWGDYVANAGKNTVG
ncbi:MAG: integrase arm-type DNA-binding domain-containing protein [Alphaproteobacteria bacterium]